jgi:hypothetical protein
MARVDGVGLPESNEIPGTGCYLCRTIGKRPGVIGIGAPSGRATARKKYDGIGVRRFVERDSRIDASILIGDDA